MSTSSGVWNGTPTITETYQWQQCDANGMNCADISGATDPSYTPVITDVGATLRAAVTGSNGGGQMTTYTPASMVVLAAVLPSNTTAPSISGADPRRPFSGIHLQVTGWERRPSRSPINGSNAMQSVGMHGYRWRHGHLVYPSDS